MKKLFIRFWPILFIFAVWFIFSSPYFVKGLVPFPGKYLVTFFPPWSAQFGMPVKNNAMPDVITQIYPWKRLTIESWKMVQVPLWNPYSFSGTPHLANYQSAVLSPVNLLFFILPEIDAWSLMILLQPLLAGLFMYFLLRTLARSKQASLIGSIAFMFSGFLTVWMVYGTLGWAVLWLPLLFAAVTRHFKTHSRWNMVVMATALAWSFFSGHFQMSVYVLIAVSAYVCFETWRHKDFKRGLELVMAVAIGMLLSAPQLLPAIDSYSNSVRSQLFTQAGGIAWNYLVTLFAPDFYGNPVTRNDWFGQYAEWASYVGVIPLLFALLSLFCKKTSQVWFFLGLFALALLIATESPVNDLIIRLKLPALSTSYNARIIVLMSFSLSALSAFGFDGMVEDWRKRTFASFRKLCLTTVICVVLLWVAVLFFPVFPKDMLLIARRNLILPTVLSFGMLGLFGAGFFRKLKMLPYLFLLLVTFDMLRYANKWMPFDPREYVFPPMKMTEYLSGEIGFYRAFGNFGGEMSMPFHIPFIEGYDAVYQRRYGEFISSVSTGKAGIPERSVVRFPKIGSFSERILQLLGVKYYIQKKSDGRSVWAYPFWQHSQYTPVYSDEHFDVYKNYKALPRAFLASSYKIAKEDKEILSLLHDPVFDAQNTVILEEKPTIEPLTGDGSVITDRYTPNEIIMKTSTLVPKLLFLSDVYDTGWRAAIDGSATQVYRADFDFRAISVPAGEHLIRMTYWPRSFGIGLWLSVIGALGMLVLLFV